jgi:HD-GYP domain-containing protein (c-di-GMP phosphodiesterase class II)
MTSERPYRDPRGPGEAIRELERVAGSQLDPAAVEAFAAAFPDSKSLPLKP